MRELSPITCRSKAAFLAVSIFVTAPLTVLWLPTVSSANNYGPASHCSNAGTPEEMFLAEITARRVSCRAARRFIIALNVHRPDLKDRKTHYRGYDCRPRWEGVAARIRCTQSLRVIRWLEGT
jgi:hypothetical protein